MTSKDKWQRCYVYLNEFGYSDSQIAALAGVTRVVISRVRRGDWPHNHQLAYEGGKRVIEAVRAVRDRAASTEGQLDLQLEDTSE